MRYAKSSSFSPASPKLLSEGGSSSSSSILLPPPLWPLSGFNVPCSMFNAASAKSRFRIGVRCFRPPPAGLLTPTNAF